MYSVSEYSDYVHTRGSPLLPWLLHVLKPVCRSVICVKGNTVLLVLSDELLLCVDIAMNIMNI